MAEQQGQNEQLKENISLLYPGLSAIELTEIYLALDEHVDVVEQIVKARQKARAVGCLGGPAVIGGGVFAWIFWKWYALLIAIPVAYLAGALYSALTAKRIERRTGLNVTQQEIVWGAAMLPPREG